MAYPSKPWYHGQIHEIVEGKQFQYDSDSRLWVHLKANRVTDAELDSEMDIVRSEFDSDLLLYVTVADHDSDLNNLNADYGSYGL